MPIIRIPQTCNSERLQKLGQPGEPCIILKVQNVGSTGEHEILDKEGRSYRLRWSTPHGGHVIRVPFSLWSQNKHRLAHDIMEAQPPQFPLVVLIEDSQQQVAPGASVAHSDATASSTLAPATIQQMADEQATREKAEQVLETLTSEQPPAEETVNTETTGPQPLMYGEMPLHQAAADLVAAKAVRIKDLAQLLEVSEDDIKTALADPESKAELASAGWVRLKDTNG